MSRNIIIYPNRGTTGATEQPYITFSGASAGTINLVVEDDGSLTWEGDTGGLFQITDNKDGLLSSVNDVSGLPIFQVYDNDYIYMGKWDEPTLIVSGQSWNIIGGSGHTVNSGVTRSAILGGGNITATTSDSVYVPDLYLTNLPSESVLGTDGSGKIIAGTGGGGGVTIDPYYTEPSTLSVTWNVSGNSTNYQTVLTGNTTLNLSNVRNGDYGTIIVEQDGTGSHTLSFGTVNGAGGTHRVVNGGGGSPKLTSNPNAIDILSFTYNGSVMYWTVGNDYT